MKLKLGTPLSMNNLILSWLISNKLQSRKKCGSSSNLSQALHSRSSLLSFLHPQAFDRWTLISPCLPGAQQLMGVHKVSAYRPFIFQKSGKSTIIRNLAVPHHFVSYLVVFFIVFVWTQGRTLHRYYPWKYVPLWQTRGN
jgi:hypothetical protein